ncbi:MAG: hypothetical protein P8X84_06105 [Candidatus Bathyarchaeota archaeon]
MIDAERRTIKIDVNNRYETKLSVENASKGFMTQEVGLGITVITPNKVIPKRASPSHTAHQSSDFRSDLNLVFDDINSTYE